jgi:hypothetical protein
VRTQLTWPELERRIKEGNYNVIVGCARSGTRWIAEVLTLTGLDVGHWRTLGDDGISSDLLAPLACLLEANVIHQVRYPVNQIGSMHTTHGYTWQFINQVLKFKDGDTLLKMCMKYWLVWNSYAEKVARYTYRIENIDNEWGKIKELTGAKGVLPDVPRNANTRKGMYKPVTWDMLEQEDAELYGHILKKAWGYGYRADDMPQRIERLENGIHQG